MAKSKSEMIRSLCREVPRVKFSGLAKHRKIPHHHPTLSGGTVNYHHCMRVTFEAVDPPAGEKTQGLQVGELVVVS